MEKLLTPSEIEKIIELRKTIHSNPELSNKEFKTADSLIKFIGNQPNKIVAGIGNTGIAFIYEGELPGKTILFRAELDALPIQEINSFAYKSCKENISHKCGHDGHMAILAGLGVVLSKNKIKRGKVVLLFQPAEETGEGAVKILADKKFDMIKPDYVFALHNLPGIEMGSIVLSNNIFASASKGMVIKLFGKTSHAAEPENGISPANATAKIIFELNNVVNTLINQLKDFSLVTIVHVKLGETAFGTSPGYAELMATLRSFNDSDMNLIVEKTVNMINEIASGESLKSEIYFTEEFPSTVNNKLCVDIIGEITEENKIKTIHRNVPYKWSEDFGHFTAKYNGALFGIGAGIETPQLHNPDYDFPDEIIETGVLVFYSIIKKILG